MSGSGSKPAREVTTRPSTIWKSPMVKHKPKGYDEARESASDSRIAFEDVERFVFEEAPGIDTADCKSLTSLRSVWEGGKTTVNPKSISGELVEAANKDPKVLFFSKFCEDLNLFESVETEGKSVPVFTLKTDLYACYDACYDWWIYRMNKLNNLSKLDNGWLKHGIRLLARFQEYKLLKTQSWWRDNKDFKLDDSSRKQWESKKRKR